MATMINWHRAPSHGDITDIELPYPGLSCGAAQLTAFVMYCGGLFTLMVTNEKVIHFTPEDPSHFVIWLRQHEIKRILVEHGA